jgi:plastocyanin
VSPALVLAPSFALTVLLAGSAARWSARERSTTGRVVDVAMIDGTSYGMRFDPVRVTVRRGDTLRFTQKGGMPHNVDFRSVPAGTRLGAQQVGPLLKSRGETYEVVIDARFAAGKHVYVCTPHEVLGMAGIVNVAE